LLGTQGAESGKKFVVDSSCVVEKGADDALDSFVSLESGGLYGSVWAIWVLWP
jgi:hypothetical protein